MPSPPSNVPPLSPTTPKRRALHERSNSQTNEQSFPPTVRLIQDQDLQDETEIYSATPYPTKPEHVLLPPASRKQGSTFDAGYRVSHSTPDAIARSSSGVSRDYSLPIHEERDISGPTSSIHGTHSSSQAWDDSLNSSRTSIPQSAPGTPRALRRGGREEDDNSSNSDDVPLPTTIKRVPRDDSSSPPAQSPVESTYSEFVHGDEGSSPNIVPIGLTSSPNIVPINSSSPNLVPLGRSSPILAPEPLTDSSLYEVNSVGTARRYIRAGQLNSSQRNSTLTTDGSLSEQLNSTPSHSIPSSPPNVPLRSYQSTSSFGGLPAVTPYRIQPSISSASSRSSRSGPDGHSPTGSSTPIQYPTIRYPSASSRAESTTISRSYVQSMTERFSGRWNPHLSTVPSEWSAERSQSVPSPSPLPDQPDESWPKRAEEAKFRDSSRPSICPVDESEIEEHGDNLTHLRSLPLRNKASGTLSHKSSLSALSNSRNLLRSPSGSSLLHVIPTWARVYYSTGAQFASLFSPDSRPSTPASPPMAAVSMFSAAYTSDPRMVSRTPLGITNPRLRPREIEYSSEPDEFHDPDGPDEPDEPPPAAIARPANPDPSDPRNHWIHDPEMDRVRTQVTMEDLPGAWSPHLHTDKRVDARRRSKWKPPSLDETAEGLFSRRNAQVYAFALGFVFPLAWIIAAFLPLPHVSHINEEATTSRPDLEHAFNNRVVLVDEVRHANARWWRNVNRIMSPVGLAIIVVVITMAVLFA